MPAKVPGHGPLNPKIAIVGEAPGTQDEIQGIPFLGSDGKLLDDMLANQGISRTQCYVTNVIKFRPPSSEFDIFYEDSKKNTPGKMLLQAWEELQAELRRVNPNLILCLGAEALRAVTGRRSVEKWRGSIIESSVGKVIATYHPAFILRVYNHRAIAELDIKRARQESHSKSLNLPKPYLLTNPSYEAVMDFLTSPHKRLAFDIETSGSLVRCCGFAPDPDHAICIPFTSNRYTVQPGSSVIFFPEHSSGGLNSHWSYEEETQILSAMDRLFRNPNIELIAQNFPFDSSYLERNFGFRFANLFMDTMIAHHCCYSELPKGLDFLASIYTRIPYYSDYDAASDEQTWIYNCWDCVATFQVCEALEKECKSHNTWDFYKNFCEPAMLALTRCGNRGVLIDQDYRRAYRSRMETELEEIRKKLSLATGNPDLNPNSPTQIKKFLYEDLKLPPQVHRVRKVITADEEAIEKLQVKSPFHAPTLQLLIDYRKKSKLIGSFLDSKLSEDGRMRTIYHITGACTGRISSSTTLDGEGGNLQQIPSQEDTGRDIRRMYIAGPGKVLVKTDLEQAEARAVAWFARITSLIENFNTPGFDVHKWNASLIYNKPVSEITKDERQEAKKCVHGANYKIGADKVAIINKIPLARARTALEKYRNAIPELSRWWSEIDSELRTTRSLRNPFGRLRIFFDRLDENTLRSAIATLPQSLIADTINSALARADKIMHERWGERAYPLMQVHDEIVYEVDEDLLDEVIPFIISNTEVPITFPLVPVPLVVPVELKVGRNWLDCVSYEKWKCQQSQKTS